MCWHTRTKPNVEVADKDIEVFKIVEVVDGRILPYFFSNRTVYGYINKEGDPLIIGDGINKSGDTLEIVDTGVDYICNFAMHSYFTIRLKIKFWNGFVKGIYIENDEGHIVDSYINHNAAIMHCVIPKGTKYAVNEVGEVVSEAIQAKKIILPFKYSGLI